MKVAYFGAKVLPADVAPGEQLSDRDLQLVPDSGGDVRRTELENSLLDVLPHFEAVCNPQAAVITALPDEVHHVVQAALWHKQKPRDTGSSRASYRVNIPTDIKHVEIAKARRQTWMGDDEHVLSQATCLECRHC